MQTRATADVPTLKDVSEGLAGAPAGRTRRAIGVRVWLVLAAWVLALALTLPFEEAIGTWFQKLAPAGTYSRRVFKLPVHLFGWWTYVGLAAALALYKARWRLLVGFAIAVLSCMASLHLVKFIVGRPRPGVEIGGVECGPYYLSPFGDPRLSLDSFPSGHATQSVLLTALFAIYFPWSRWILIPMTVLVCLGRLVLDRHYPSDVVGGVGLALLTICVCTRWLGPSFFPRLRIGGQIEVGRDASAASAVPESHVSPS